jgi:urease accessory protein UreE
MSIDADSRRPKLRAYLGGDYVFRVPTHKHLKEQQLLLFQTKNESIVETIEWDIIMFRPKEGRLIGTMMKYL